jgi:hypothetical protein
MGEGITVRAQPLLVFLDIAEIAAAAQQQRWPESTWFAGALARRHRFRAPRRPGSGCIAGRNDRSNRNIGD